MTNTERIIAYFFPQQYGKDGIFRQRRVCQAACSRSLHDQIFQKNRVFRYREFQHLYEIKFFRWYSVMMRSCCTESLIPTRKYCCILTADYQTGLPVLRIFIRGCQGLYFRPGQLLPVRRGSSSCVLCGWGFGGNYRQSAPDADAGGAYQTGGSGDRHEHQRETEAVWTRCAQPGSIIRRRC